jgi:hypothetical protein
MLLQEHVTSFLQRPPMDPDEWNNILAEENQKEKRQNEWKEKRSNPRKDGPQVTNSVPEENLASGSGGYEGETGSGDSGDDDVEEDDSSYGDIEEMVDHDRSGASSDFSVQ